MLVIRSAGAEDVERLVQLCAELGYERTLENVMQTLGEISEASQHTVLVAVLDSRVVGWIEVTCSNYLTSGAEAQICGLIVDSETRGQGIGKELVRAAESWARQKGQSAIRVRSRDTRERAHKFYLDLGYDIHKKQLVFRKDL